MLLVPINPNVKQRETDWICVCPNCQHERIISYAQKWNISTGKYSDKCKSCRLELGEITINIDGLKLGRKHNHSGRSYENKGTKYRNLFIPVSDNTKEKQRNSRLGKFAKENHWNWQGGKSTERQIATASDKYKQLRILVFTRDNYTCQLCNIRGGKLEMDHIKEWCNYPELRYDSTNCRTLCKKCHGTTPNFGSKAIKRVK